MRNKGNRGSKVWELMEGWSEVSEQILCLCEHICEGAGPWGGSVGWGQVAQSPACPGL